MRTYEHIVDRLALDLFREAAMLSRTAKADYTLNAQAPDFACGPATVSLNVY